MNKLITKKTTEVINYQCFVRRTIHKTIEEAMAVQESQLMTFQENPEAGIDGNSFIELKKILPAAPLLILSESNSISSDPAFNPAEYLKFHIELKVVDIKEREQIAKVADNEFLDFIRVDDNYVLFLYRVPKMECIMNERLLTLSHRKKVMWNGDNSQFIDLIRDKEKIGKAIRKRLPVKLFKKITRLFKKKEEYHFENVTIEGEGPFEMTLLRDSLIEIAKNRIVEFFVDFFTLSRKEEKGVSESIECCITNIKLGKGFEHILKECMREYIKEKEELMDTRTGVIRELSEEDRKALNKALGKSPPDMIAVTESQMTKKQKETMQVSKHDNKSELGKLFKFNRNKRRRLARENK